MDLIQDFNLQTNKVLINLKQIISSYPSALLETALTYLKKFHLCEESSIKSGFCYLIPFWLMETLELNDEQCHITALGNCFALLYFMIQDELYDNDNNLDYVLPLSNLFYMDFIKCYMQLLPSDSIFWNYFYDYIRQWSESILWERTLTIKDFLSFDDSDFIRLSQKAAPLKIPFAALCCLSGKKSLIQSFSKMMDYDQAAFQMIDDWKDWHDDLYNHNPTYLIAKSMEYCRLSELTNLEEVHIKRAIYIGGVLDMIMGKAQAFIHEAENCIQNIDAPYLKLYLKEEFKASQTVINKLHHHGELVYSGGFNNLISKLSIYKTKGADNEV